MKQQLKTLKFNRFFMVSIFLVFSSITFFSVDAFAISEQEMQKDIRTYWALKNIQKKREHLLPNISNLHADKIWKDAFNKIQKLLIGKYLPFYKNNKNIYLRFYAATEERYNQERSDEMVKKFHANLKKESIARKKNLQKNKTNIAKTLNTNKTQVSAVKEYANWIGWAVGIALIIAVLKFQRKNQLTGRKAKSQANIGRLISAGFGIAIFLFYFWVIGLLLRKFCDLWGGSCGW